MPTIIGSKSGTRPYLELDWSITSQNVANNQSTINLKLYLRVEYNIGYNARYTGVLQGQSFTANAGYLSKPGRYLLAQRDITVGHNSDGTKTQSFSASYNISITWGGTYHSSISLSGSGTLTPIPRGSTLSAFSFASSLQAGTANTINYTVARHSGNYRHQLQLRDGSVTVAQWDNVSSNGSDTLSLTGAQVDTILGRMSTVTSKTFNLRLSTRSGHNGGWIGSSVTRNADASVNANVKPTISSTSATPTGNSWAVGKGFYVQGQTGVQAEFSSSARGGAGVKSRSISIGSLSSGGSAVGGVFRHSHSRLNTTGDITITYKITDTRDRSASSTRKINVKAYTLPQITSFTVGRSSPTSSTVTIKSQGSIHGMGGQNTGTMTVKQQGVTSPVRTLSLSNTTPSFNDSFNRTVATSASANFTITVTDSLGNSATSTSTIGTAFMEFSVRKGTGVGIGKVHERGVLDVDGDVYFAGDIQLKPKEGAGTPGFRMISQDSTGHAYIEYYGPDNTRRAYIGIPSKTSLDMNMHNEQGGNINLIGSSVRANGNEIWTNGTVRHGSTNNGSWVRFPDGTMIVRGSISFNLGGRRDQYYGMPSSFIDKNFGLSMSLKVWSDSHVGWVSKMVPIANNSGQFYILLPSAPGSSGEIQIEYTAIGRWK